jgi:hypothetical protein
MDLEYLINTYNYSEHQMNRYSRVRKELSKTWKKVIKELKFCKNYGMDIDNLNRIMTVGLYRLFFHEYNYNFNNKNPEIMELKRMRNYKSKKLRKLTNNIYEL